MQLVMAWKTRALPHTTQHKLRGVGPSLLCSRGHENAQMFTYILDLAICGTWGLSNWMLWEHRRQRYALAIGFAAARER